MTLLDIQAVTYSILSVTPDFPEFFELLTIAQEGNYSNFEIPPIPLSAIVAVPLECGDYRKYISPTDDMF